MATVEDDLSAQLWLASKIQEGIDEALKSPLGLYKLCFRTSSGKPVIINWMHEEWNQILLRERNALIEGARGLTKTTFMTAFALWLIGHNPNIRITWLSSNDRQASKRLRAVRTIIQENKLYQATFPHIRISKKKDDANTVSLLTVERDAPLPDATVEAVGVLSAGTGSRSDVLLLDDIVDERNALLYPALRPKVLSKLQSDWMQILDQEYGRIIAIYNTWHESDAHAWLETHTNWLHRTYAHGKEGDPYFSVFPELFTPERLKQLRIQEGPVHYARARLCRRLNDETVAILPQQLPPYTKEILTKERLVTARAFLSIDPASGKKLQEGKLDNLGICVGLLWEGLLQSIPKEIRGYLIAIVAAFQTKLGIPDQVQLVKMLYKQWHPEALVVEAEGLADLHQWLWADGSIPPDLILPMTTGNLSKGQRLLSVTPFLRPSESGHHVVFFHPRTLKAHPERTQLVLQNGTVAELEHCLRYQLVNFPTEKDDAMDAFTQLLRYIRIHHLPDLLEAGPGIRPSLKLTSILSAKPVNTGGQPKTLEELSWEAHLKEQQDYLPPVDELLSRLPDVSDADEEAGVMNDTGEAADQEYPE